MLDIKLIVLRLSMTESGRRKLCEGARRQSTCLLESCRRKASEGGLTYCTISIAREDHIAYETFLGFIAAFGNRGNASNRAWSAPCY